MCFSLRTMFESLQQCIRLPGQCLEGSRSMLLLSGVCWSAPERVFRLHPGICRRRTMLERSGRRILLLQQCSRASNNAVRFSDNVGGRRRHVFPLRSLLERASGCFFAPAGGLSPAGRVGACQEEARPCRTRFEGGLSCFGGLRRPWRCPSRSPEALWRSTFSRGDRRTLCSSKAGRSSRSVSSPARRDSRAGRRSRIDGWSFPTSSREIMASAPGALPPRSARAETLARPASAASCRPGKSWFWLRRGKDRRSAAPVSAVTTLRAVLSPSFRNSAL